MGWLDGEIPVLGGSGHYRMGCPAKYLPADRFETVVGTVIFDKANRRLGVRPWPVGDEDPEFVTDLDIVVLARWMHADLVAEIRMARGSGQIVINDVDDHYDRLDPRNQAYGVVASDPVENKDHYRNVILASNVVTVSTVALAAHYTSLGAERVVILPNGVEADAFQRQLLPESFNHDPTIGWVGAVPWRSGDVEQLRRCLPEFAAKHPAVMFRHDGHVPGWPEFWKLAGLPRDRVTEGPMRPPEDIPRLYDEIDVGLVPLNRVPFNDAKSWIKGLEYAAAGIPFVAQDLPEYRRLERDYGIGVTVGGPGQWRRALERYLDPRARSEAAQANLARVRALSWDHGHVRHWADLYESLV
jgi:glycosyltransferase involved in cell wall biosynthesis